MPGIGRVRMALTKLANEPSVKGNEDIKKALIKALYTEIRAARIAGHSWNKVREAILADVSIRLSEQALVRYFAEVDKEYEERTGVKALPMRVSQIRRKKAVRRPRKIKDEACTDV